MTRHADVCESWCHVFHVLWDALQGLVFTVTEHRQQHVSCNHSRIARLVCTGLTRLPLHTEPVTCSCDTISQLTVLMTNKKQHIETMNWPEDSFSADQFDSSMSSSLLSSSETASDGWYGSSSSSVSSSPPSSFNHKHSILNQVLKYVMRWETATGVYLVAV